MASIHILPMHFSDQNTLQHVVEAISQELGWSVVIDNFSFDHTYAYDKARQQYHSSQILLGLRSNIANQKDKILAVTNLDLFIPILTFVFGEAQLDGPSAVVSTFRLRPELYGLHPDQQLTVERLIKESIHELGHTFGLLHCLKMGCVLNASTYVEEIDLKQRHFCIDCMDAINENQKETMRTASP